MGARWSSLPSAKAPKTTGATTPRTERPATGTTTPGEAAEAVAGPESEEFTPGLYTHPRYPCRVSAFAFPDQTARIVFPTIPKEQASAFVRHCQTFTP